MSSECEEMNHRCLFIVASVCTWLSGVAAAVTNPFGILTPGGYLSQKAIGWIDHFTLSGLGLLERNEMTSRYITVEKQIGHNMNATQTIHLLDFKGTGSLPPMLILHGISSCGADYYPLVRHLQKHSCRVLALDLPGHGLSVSSLDMSLKEMVELSVLAVGQCVKELAAEESAHAGGGDSPALSPERKQRDSTGSNSGGGGGGGGGSSGQGRAMSRPILLGNSLGGFIATKCAIGMPDAIGATVLISPGGAPLDAESLHRVHGIFAMKTLGDACRFVELVLGKEDNDIPFGVRHVLGWAARERNLRPSVQRIFNEVIVADTDVFRLSAQDLKSIQSPVLLVWGKREEVFTEEHFEWFNTHLCARTSQRTQVFRPDKLGHIPHLDGAMLSEAIAAFLHDSSV